MVFRGGRIFHLWPTSDSAYLTRFHVDLLPLLDVVTPVVIILRKTAQGRSTQARAVQHSTQRNRVILIHPQSSER